jgi:hypothetical protein
MSIEQDASVVRRYVRHLQNRTPADDDLSDDAIVDHEATVLWALARAICGEGIVANVPLLRRASVDLLEQGGRRLCRDAERRSVPASVHEVAEASALKELGRALIDMRARLELRQ